MTLLKLYYDWCVLPPAHLIDALVLIPIGFAPLIAVTITWLWLVEGINDGRSRFSRFVTYIVAGTITLYVFAVTGTALIEFLQFMAEWMADKP